MRCQRGSSAFTILEMLIVIAVIIVLVALAYPVTRILLERGRSQNTAGVVMSVANAITGHGETVVNVTVAPDRPPQARRIFDIDDDRILDADPVRAGGTLQAIAPAEYRGFLATTGAAIPDEFVAADDQVTDAWGRPLRVAFRAGGYANADHGVWSIGPDGIDQGGAEGSDDIVSWR